MAFVPWKDRVTSTPHRYKLTEVSADTYDLEAVPGSISEAGTPVNAEHLDRLIQRDGDDIKDTVTTFSEASTRANIGTGESAATLFGKIKKWYTDLKSHAFATPSTSQGTGTTTVPSDKLLRDSSFAAVYTSLSDSRLSGIDGNSTQVDIINAMSDNSVMLADFGGNVNKPAGLTLCTIFVMKTSVNRNTLCVYDKYTGQLYLGAVGTVGGAQTFSGWKKVATTDSPTFTGTVTVPTTPSGPSSAVAKSYADLKVALAGAETITGIKTFATGATPLITDAPTTDLMAVNKAYADGLSTPYSKVIRTQAQFDALIASPTWLDAVSVALVGQFTVSNGIKIPATVKQIHGFNSAKITITNFVYNASTAKAGMWYATRPTTNEYSIRDLEVDCNGNSASAFYNCSYITNCTGTGTGGGPGFNNCDYITNCIGNGTAIGAAHGYGFRDCNNLTNCTGTGTNENSAAFGYGFHGCNHLTNCVGTGIGGDSGRGFYTCNYLTNCVGKGVDSTDHSTGYGFTSITYASNCKDGGSDSDMWVGTNKNIDVDTCCKTPVTANNTTLNI